MERLTLCRRDRGTGYVRRAVRQDVLYNYFRFRDVSISVAKKTRTVTRVTDALAASVSPALKSACEQAELESLCHIEEFDDVPVEQIYSHIHRVRLDVLGREAVEQYLTKQAMDAPAFHPDGIDQQRKKIDLMEQAQALIFVLTEASLYSVFKQDLEKARLAGKQLWIVDSCLIPSGLLPEDVPVLEYDGGLPCVPQLQDQIDSGSAALLFYGEEGLCACRGLRVDAVVHSGTAGYHAQALTGLWEGQSCLVFVPKGMDMTGCVPLTQKTRLNYSILSRLWQDQGDGIYALTVEELYRRYPRYFMNIYSGTPGKLPLSVEADSLQDFDRQLDRQFGTYLSGFQNAEYFSAYFDEALKPAPISYSGEPQPGILVQAARIRKAAGAQVLSCEKGVTPRQMFRKLALPGTSIVSNFLFFMTPKLGILYNDLRADRPMEQADAASGHLDYMRAAQTETFPLFSKACVAMKEDGRFLFFNFRLGGGSVGISGISFRWEAADVDSDTAPLRIYTPYYSASDRDADRDTYRKAVGAGRVNVVLLRDKVTCIRKGDVLLPSVGMVLSLTEEAAAPLLQKCAPLADGYYDVSGLTLTVQLNPPAGIDPEDWAKVRWAYGGGLTLIREGVGLCDGDHMEQWFDTEGWTSPLSRQTQESNLHSLVKHPRTAIGCTKDGALVVLVYSGRTWRSTGADYREMIAIARQLFPDIHYLMNCDGGGSAMLGMVTAGDFQELSFPSTSSGSCAGQVRPINTVFYIPIE